MVHDIGIDLGISLRRVQEIRCTDSLFVVTGDEAGEQFLVGRDAVCAGGGILWARRLPGAGETLPSGEKPCQE
jgi:hypothetical protein